MIYEDTHVAESYDAPITGMGLSVATPCGLFETEGGDRYLVAKDCVGKVAVALRHRIARPFTWMSLTPSVVDTGTWLGNGEIELTHETCHLTHETYPVEHALGTLAVENEGWISLLCQEEWSGFHWALVATTDETAEDGCYDGWRILKWGRTFFEWSPPFCATRLALPFSLLGSL